VLELLLCRHCTTDRFLSLLDRGRPPVAAQHGAGADAASGPKIVGILTVGISPTIFPLYRCGAAKRGYDARFCRL